MFLVFMPVDAFQVLQRPPPLPLCRPARDLDLMRADCGLVSNKDLRGAFLAMVR